MLRVSAWLLRCREAVIKATVGYYAPFAGNDARQAITKALSDSAGTELSALGQQEEELQNQLKQISRTIRNLLDNLTKANRHLVDRRIEELSKEQQEVERRLGAIGHLVMSGSQRKDLVEQMARFIGNLEQVLRQGPLDDRQAALRRCVERVDLDLEGRGLTICLRKLPLVAGTPTQIGSEPVKVSF